MNDERLENLEIKLSYQEHTIQELNDVICSQQKTIDMLEKRYKLLENRIIELIEKGSDSDIPSERPPHY